MEHHYLQDQGKEVAGCFSHLEKVERVCKSETRRGLAKPVVFLCYKHLNYAKLQRQPAFVACGCATSPWICTGWHWATQGAGEQEML